MLLQGNKFNVNNVCGFLRINHGKADCLKYWKRPEFCYQFPVNEKELIDGCGYSFTKEDK